MKPIYTPLLSILSLLSLSACSSLHPVETVGDMWKHAKTAHPVASLRERNARQAVKAFDKDMDTYLSASEFKAAMTGSSKYRLKASQSDLTVARYVAADFKRRDINKDGHLSFEEFHAGQNTPSITIPDQPRYTGLRQSLTPAR